MNTISLIKHCLLIALLCCFGSACSNDAAGNRVVGELASDRVEISIESNEVIVDLPVAEGSTVAKGQVLMQQDSARATARRDEAIAAVAEKQARLAELTRGPRSEQIAAARASVGGAEKDVRFRQAETLRVQELYEQNLASADALDKARAALDAAESTHNIRIAQLREQLAGTTIEELTQAEHAVDQAAARLRIAQIDLQQLTTRAPQNGILDSRLFEIGERPVTGQTVLVLLGGDQVHARVFIPERLRAHVSAGSKAIIHVDGIDTAIPGRVRWVANEAAFTPYYALTEHDRGRLSYVAKIDIDDTRPRLPDGVPVDVEFELD